jgi:uncharacterized protein (TIGR02421 family)
LEALVELERDIVAGVSGLRILSALAWQRSTLEAFLSSWRAGNPILPRPDLQLPPGLARMADAMSAVMRRAPREHPVGDLLWRTAWSYRTAVQMLLAAGTPEFTQHSIELYGRPDRVRPTQGWSDLDAAEYLLKKTSDLLTSSVMPVSNRLMSAEEMAGELRRLIDQLFVVDPIEVVLADDLAARAAASSGRVRLRTGAVFSELDLDQLFAHEVMIHAATMANGRRQPFFDVLSLGAPRTTRHQEGLATFAEIVTGAMDLVRLRRIALRVRGVSMALEGADFIEVFRMFLEEGQGEEESAQSAMRVFRGGDPRGGVAFTKDGAYIGGLVEVHTFLRVAVRDGRPDYIPYLFAGRLTLRDVVELDPVFREGLFAGPHYMPTWAADLRRLTAMLSFSAFTSMVDLDNVHLDVFSDIEDAVIDGSMAGSA